MEQFSEVCNNCTFCKFIVSCYFLGQGICFHLIILAYSALVQNSFGTPPEQLFSFGSNAGATGLGPSEDGNSGPIQLTGLFLFYGTDHSYLICKFLQ